MNSFDEDGSDIDSGDELEDEESSCLWVGVFFFLLFALFRRVGELVTHGGGNDPPGDFGSGNPGGALGYALRFVSTVLGVSGLSSVLGVTDEL